MKKILAILLAVVMLCALASCKKGEDSEVGEDRLELIDEEVYIDEETGDEFVYDVNEAGKYEIIGFTSKSNTAHKIEIPAAIDNVEVSGIGKSAFKANNQITEVVIPDSITYIGDLAFYGCLYLTTVEMPDSITELGVCAFYNCYALTTVKLSAGLEVISESAFLNCGALEEITIPESVKTIEDGAFMFCTGLKEITIPESVLEIKDVAFYGDESLQKATLPANVGKLGKHVFNAANEEFTLVAPEESVAAKYAADNGYAFEKLVVETESEA